MRVRGVTGPIAVAVGIGLVCARASADGAISGDGAEARAASVAASGQIAAMEAASRRARVILRSARGRGRAGEVACADEALSRVDVALRAARAHATLLRDAWVRRDVPRAREELARVATAAEGARAANVLAERCIDEPRPAEGTTVRVFIASP